MVVANRPTKTPPSPCPEPVSNPRIKAPPSSLSKTCLAITTYRRVTLPFVIPRDLRCAPAPAQTSAVRSFSHGSSGLGLHALESTACWPIQADAVQQFSPPRRKLWLDSCDGQQTKVRLAVAEQAGGILRHRKEVLACDQAWARVISRLIVKHKRNGSVCAAYGMDRRFC